MSDLSLFYDRYFPTTTKARSNKQHCATIGIGGNIGDVKERFKKLYFYLQQSNIVDVVATSPILKNPPFGYLDQPYFYNAIIILRTDLNPFDLLRYLLFVEKRFKRIRAFKDSPRTLDLDMIFYDKISIKTKRLTLPHPQFQKRESVLIPLGLLKYRCEDETLHIYGKLSC